MANIMTEDKKQDLAVRVPKILNWRNALFLTLGWLLFEEIIRRLIPGQPAGIAVTKDVLLLVAYILFIIYLVRDKIKLWAPPFWPILSVFVAFVLINFFRSLDLKVIALSFRSYIWYMPLFYLGYYLFETKEKLLKFLQFFSAASIPLFLFAVVQYIFWNVNFPLFHPFLSTNQVHSTFEGVLGNIYRIPSFFGDSQRFAIVVLFMFFVSLSLYFIDKKNKDSGLNKKLIYASIICSYGSILISASRTGFLASLMGLFIYFFVSSVWLEREKYAAMKGCARFAVTVAVIIAILFVFSSLGLRTASYQLDSFGSISREIFPRIENEAAAISMHLQLFSRSGSILSAGSQYITDSYKNSNWVERLGVESGISKDLYELGFLGFSLYILFFGSLIYYACKTVYKLGGFDLNYFALAVVIMIPIFLLKFVIHYEAGDDSFALIPLWTMVGLLFGLTKSNFDNTMLHLEERQS